VPLARDLAARLPGSKLRMTGDTGTLVFETDGVWLDARLRESPRIEIFIRTIDVGDFTLEIHPSDQGIELDVARHLIREAGSVYYTYREEDIEKALAGARDQVSFVEHCEVEQDDDELAALWIDRSIEEACRDGLWLVADKGLTGVTARPAGYRILLERAEVLVTRSSELDVARLLGALRAGAIVASRPHRLGRAWLELARGLGGTTTADRWDLGREFAAVFDRGAAEVRIDTVKERQLVTRVRARRIGGDGATWRWGGELGALPAPLGALRTLLAAARPQGAVADRDQITLTFPGMPLDPERLGPAIEIVGRLAVDLAAPTGPYR
jgi:hypothetical protein